MTQRLLSGRYFDEVTARSWPLVSKAHNESQGYVDSCNVAFVETTDLSSDSFAPNCHRLVRHHLRSHPQTVLFGRFDDHSKIRGVTVLGSHLANHHGSMVRR